MAASTNPLKQIVNIRREEAPMAFLMLMYFFLVIASFWILKPLKKGLFISFYDQTGFDLFSWHLDAAQAELIAKVLNMVVAFVAVTVFTLLVRHFQRQKLTYIFSGFFVVCYILYSFTINQPGSLTVWSFYLFGDLYSTLMVATFFAFLNDSVNPDAAKRLYGLIGLGGVLGGTFGTTVLRTKIEDLSMAQWLWICLAVGLIIGVVQAATQINEMTLSFIPKVIAMAAVALIFNLALILALLSLLQATLTLPGIAGVVLTIGMAVDANVLILERIKEEARNGRSPIAAVDAGYKRALTTIIDSNLTTLIAALLLFNFGTGPIKGFAVTLSMGIVSSMFTAIMLTRLLVVIWLRRKRPSKLPL